MSRLLPRRFTDAANTDVRRTFDRIRWERKRAGIEETRVFVGTIVVGHVGKVKAVQRTHPPRPVLRKVVG